MVAEIIITEEEKEDLQRLLNKTNELTNTLIKQNSNDEAEKVAQKIVVPFINQNKSILKKFKAECSIKNKTNGLNLNLKKTKVTIDDINLSIIKNAVFYCKNLIEYMCTKYLDNDTEAKIKACCIKNIEEIQGKIDVLNDVGIYHKYMIYILEYLQYLVGYNKAIKNGTVQDNIQQRDVFYFDPINKIGSEKYPDICEDICQNDLDKRRLNEKSLKDLVHISEEKEKELRNIKDSKRNMIVSKNILCNPKFKEIINEIKENKDCTQVDEEKLSCWAEAIESVLSDNGWHFRYYKELKSNEKVNDYFNEGNSIAIEIPAMFEKKESDIYEWLAGYTGVYTESSCKNNRGGESNGKQHY